MEEEEKTKIEEKTEPKEKPKIEEKTEPEEKPKQLEKIEEEKEKLTEKTKQLEKIDKEKLIEERQKYAKKGKQIAEKVSNDVNSSVDDLIVSMKKFQKTIDKRRNSSKKNAPESKIDINLIETSANYYIEIDAVGVEKENINIEATEEKITINLEFPQHLDHIDDENPEYIIENLETGLAERTVKFPGKIKFKEIESEHELGKITLKIPKLELETEKIDL